MRLSFRGGSECPSQICATISPVSNMKAKFREPTMRYSRSSKSGPCSAAHTSCVRRRGGFGTHVRGDGKTEKRRVFSPTKPDRRAKDAMIGKAAEAGEKGRRRTQLV